VSDEDPVRPAALVSVAVMVCAPWARPVGVKAQTPEPLAVVLPRTVEPSLNVTVALASAVPVSASLDVNIVGAGGMRERRGHGRRGGVIGEAQRRRAGQACGIGLGGGDGLRTLSETSRAEAPDAGAIGVVLPRTVEPSAQRHRGIGVGSAGQRIVGGDVCWRRWRAPAPRSRSGVTVS